MNVLTLERHCSHSISSSLLFHGALSYLHSLGCGFSLDDHPFSVDWNPILHPDTVQVPLELGASPDSLNQKNPFLALIPHSTSFKCKTDCALCAFLTLEGHLLLVGYETQVVGCYWQKKKENTRKYQCAWHDFGFDFIYIMCVCVCVCIWSQNKMIFLLGVTGKKNIWKPQHHLRVPGGQGPS